MKAAPAPQPLLTFGQCLKQILAKRKLSASALSRMMEQKSRNSIFRILDDTGGIGAQTAFYENLIASDCLFLTQEEKEELARSLEVSSMGFSGYMSNQAMHRLLGSVDLAEPMNDFRVDRSSDGSRTSFSEAMQRLAGENRFVRFIIMGCCYRSIFEIIAEKFAQNKNCRVSIRHYMYTGGDEIIRFVSAIQPVLYSEKYEGYCIEENLFNPEREQIYRTNNIIAHCVGKNGKKKTYLVMLIDSCRMLVVDPCNEKFVSLMEKMIDEDEPQMHRLKASFPVSSSPEDYLAYTESFRKLESGRAIYDIKPDVPIQYIHPDLLVTAAGKGFLEQDFACQEEVDALVDKFYQVHLKRYENFMGKRRVTHTIFSRDAMFRFAQTGRQSDHFFAISPYEKKERVEILKNLQEQNENNPYFNLYFFKPNYRAPQTEICLYEGKGVVISSKDTDYRKGSQTEALITQPEFSRKYKEFYVKGLLNSKVLSPEETTSVFDELIETAENSLI